MNTDTDGNIEKEILMGVMESLEIIKNNIKKYANDQIELSTHVGEIVSELTNNITQVASLVDRVDKVETHHEFFKQNILDLDRRLCEHEEDEQKKVKELIAKGIKEKNPELALEIFDLALNISPTSTCALCYKSRVLMQLNRDEESLKYLSLALKVSTDEKLKCANFWGLRGYILNKLERYHEAIVCSKRAIELDQNDYDAYIDLTLSFYFLDEWDLVGINLQESEKFFEELEPERKIIFLALKSEWFLEQEKWDLSMKTVEKAEQFAQNPQTKAKISSLYGLIYSRKEEYQKAIDKFRESIELDSENLEAWGNLGIIFDEMGNYEDSINSYQKVVSVDPSVKCIYCRMATSSFNEGHHEESLKYSDSELSNDSHPTCLLFWRNRTVIQRQLNIIEEALKSVDQVLRIDASNEEGLEMRTALLKSRDRESKS